MTERWRSYITRGVEAAGGPVPFALTQWNYLTPLYLSVRRALPRGGRVLDVGCGSGIFTALLAHHGFDLVGVDQDPDIVAYAREMADYFRSPAKLERADATDLSPYHGHFDLVYSIGVVEHFEAEVSVQLIREQARCGRFVLVSVPTRHTHYAAPVTDERLYRRRQVSALVRRAGLRVKESFVFGDLPTRTATMLQRGLPKVLYRGLQHFGTYAMSVGCLGGRPSGDGAPHGG